MTAVSWIILLFDIGIAADAARRPASAWAAADRKKAFWVTLLAIFGVVMFIPYVIGVLPRLVDAGRAVGTSPFERAPPARSRRTEPRKAHGSPRAPVCSAPIRCYPQRVHGRRGNVGHHVRLTGAQPFRYRG